MSKHPDSHRAPSAATGELGELLTRAELVRQGWVVCTPEGHSVPYDVVALRGRKVVRIQVKSTSNATISRVTAQPTSYRVTVARRKPGRAAVPYGSEVDVFACVCTKTGTVAFLPAARIPSGASDVVVGIDPAGGCAILAEDLRLLQEPQ